MIKQTKLHNGATIITLPVASSKTTTALIIFSTGSKYETAKIRGLSHFLEHMMFKGTVKRPTALSIANELDRIGSEFNAFTSKECTGYWIKASAEHLTTTLDVLSDMLLNSQFLAEEIAREKGVIIEEYNMYLDSPREYVEDVFEECLYGNTPAGWSVIGTKPSITGLKRADFVKYFSQQYTGPNATIVLAGKLPSNINALVKKYFGNLKNKVGKKKLVVKEKTGSLTKVFYKKTDQAHLQLGAKTFGYGNKDEAVLSVLSAVLGGSMSSRLFVELRERNGLAYYVRANNENYSDHGYLAIRAGVPLDKLDLALKIIRGELKKIVDQPVANDELNKVKQLIAGRVALQLEGSDDLASWYAQQAVILKQQTKPRRGLLTPEQYVSAIKKVSARQVQELAKKIFVDKNMCLAVVGPFDSRLRVRSQESRVKN